MNRRGAIDLPAQNILVIDDELVVGLSCERILTADGHFVNYQKDSYEGLQEALSGNYDIVLLDLVMPELDGMDVLRKMRESGISAEVIIITGYSTVKTAVEAMRLGAADYVSKPFSPDELRLVVNKVIERSALIQENNALRKELESQQGFEGMIGESKAMERVFSLIKQVAPTQGTVLITGESGTGKEMVARAIHNLSERSEKPFVGFDCTSLVPTLLESELFGHVKGAFSGAVAEKEGLFQMADRGTLFLDEVGNITLETQAKLLRVLEMRRVKKVGDVAEKVVDIRLLAASNRNLGQMVQNEEFRADLYYRLNVVPIHVPPLRERKDDIPLLAMSFLERFRKTSTIKAKVFTPEALEKMERYSWPGNVRELRNIMERIAILCDSEQIEVRHLPEEIKQTTSDFYEKPLPRNWEDFKSLKKEIREVAVEDMEKRFLLNALERNNWNVTRAAEDVGMQRTNFHSLMQKYEITGKG